MLYICEHFNLGDGQQDNALSGLVNHLPVWLVHV